MRKHINQGDSRAIRKVKMEQSKTNNLIQLADYVAGVINRDVNGKADSASYRKTPFAKELTRQVWPE